jgi:hypothetical protein
MTSRQMLVYLALGICLAGCGKVGDLEPRTGNTHPVKAYGQTTEQSAQALSAPSVQARPGRTDELLKRSERRIDDPFDVPPGEEPKPFIPEDPATQTSPKKQ